MTSTLSRGGSDLSCDSCHFIGVSQNLPRETNPSFPPPPSLTRMRTRKNYGWLARLVPMYSVMGGAPVGCSPRIKGGVPGRAIAKILLNMLWQLKAYLVDRLSFSFPRLYASHIPHKMACMSSQVAELEPWKSRPVRTAGGQRKGFFVSEHT